ncbi:hypothetical protein [Spirosoma areae]
MKTILVAGILLLGVSGQSFSMGHPHNVFAARKQMKAKTSASVTKCKVTSSVSLQQMVKLSKATLSERLMTALKQVRPAQSN